MSLLDEARSLAKRPGGTCGVALLTSRLGGVEQAELAEALASDVSADAVAKALGERGHTISYQTIMRHRGGKCACPR